MTELNPSPRSLDGPFLLWRTGREPFPAWIAGVCADVDGAAVHQKQRTPVTCGKLCTAGGLGGIMNEGCGRKDSTCAEIVRRPEHPYRQETDDQQPRRNGAAQSIRRPPSKTESGCVNPSSRTQTKYALTTSRLPESVTGCHRLTGQILSHGDNSGRVALFLCDVDTGRWRRSQVAKSASVHQSKNAAGRA